MEPIQTERLLIRQFEFEDEQDFAELIRDKMRSPLSVYDDQFPTDDAGIRGVLSYFCGTEEFLAVVLEGSVIGFLACNATGNGAERNFGICLRSDRQGMGYAIEAGRALLSRMDCPVVSGTAEKNERAVRLLTKLGFCKTGEQEASFATDADGREIRFRALEFRLPE